MTETGELSVILPQKLDPNKTVEAVRSLVETVSGKIEFVIGFGDLTGVNADAIVCPANPGFQFSEFSGVQRSIARNAGMETFKEAEKKANAAINAGLSFSVLDRDSKVLEGVPLGFSITTNAGKLEGVKFIIHVNNFKDGPTSQYADDEVIRLSVHSALGEAETNGLESVAFPALGTGFLGVGFSDSLRGTVLGIRDHFQNNQHSKIKKIYYIVYAQPSLENAQKMKQILANKVFPLL